mmetsp:Transcript_34424/g.78478  ORF Transcript_34424/g.78478 Transcript_34424/m.78478 type:complete len:118 (+) Transcript_34424:45-398(+)
MYQAQSSEKLAAHVERRPRDDISKKFAKEKAIVKPRKTPQQAAEELQEEALNLAKAGSVRAAVDTYRDSIYILDTELEADPTNVDAAHLKEVAEYKLAKLKPFMGMEYLIEAAGHDA